MADQTQVTDRARRGADATANGADSPATAVRQNVADFGYDVATLAELQGKLLLADLNEATGRATVPGALLALGAGLLMGALPLLPAALALLLAFDAGWSFAPAFFVAAIVGLVVGGLLCLTAWLLFRRRLRAMQRSRDELVQNLKWIKDVLKRHRRTGEVCR